jgi:hypothetical protein
MKGIWCTECLDGGAPPKRKIAYAQRVKLYTFCHVPPRTEYALAVRIECSALVARHGPRHEREALETKRA